MEPLVELKRSIRDPAVIAASFGASLVALALPFSMIQIYDRIIPNEGYATLGALGLIVFSAVLIEFVLRMARESILGRAGARFEIEGYRAAFDALFAEQPASAKESREGELMTRLTSIDRLRDLHTGPTSSALLDLPMAIFFLLFISAISPVISTVVLVILAISFAVLRVYRRRVRNLHQQRLDLESQRQDYLAEILGKSDTVRALSLEDQMQRRYERLLGRAAKITDEMVKSVQAAKSFTATIGIASPLIATSTGAYLYSVGELTVGSLAAVVILTGRIVQPVLQFEAYVAGADNARVAARDYRFLVDRPRQRSGDQPLLVVDDLELVDVTSEPDRDTGVFFEGVSMRFEIGSCTRITASTAEHASAFLRLLAGECRLTEGELLANGQDLFDFSLGDRASAIRLLTTQFRMLDGTLMENLTNFNEAAYRREAMELSREIGLDKHITVTREGYETHTGGTGEGPLPKSLVDATGIVANLVGDPNVILFDEANAALDVEMDTRLRAMLEERKKHSIIVMVSNRPSFARLADREIDISEWVGCRDSAQQDASGGVVK